MKLKRYQLSKLTNIKYGKNQKNVISVSGTYPIYGTGGLIGYATNSLYDKPSVLIGRKGTIDKVRYIAQPFWTVDTLFYTEVNEDIVFPKYFYYLMCLVDLNKYNEGTTVPSLRVETLNRLEFELPPLEYQRKVLTELNSIENKINLNMAINNNLQKMAYIKYMHMFYGKKANGKFGDIIVEQPKSTIKVSDAKESFGITPFFTSGESILKWPEALVNGRNCYLNTGGNADVKFYVGKAAYSTDTWCITAKNDMSDYLYLLLDSIRIELNLKFFQGTGLKHLQKPLLKDRTIYIPSQNELSEFNTNIQPWLSMISDNIRESEELKSLRDWLLPMLMSGQITVSDQADKLSFNSD